jgi:hypothetical protein
VANTRRETVRKLLSAVVGSPSSVAGVTSVSAGVDIIAVSSGLGAAATVLSHSLSAERNMDAEHARTWAGVVTTSNAMRSMESNPLAAAAAGRLLVVKDSELQTICNGRQSSSPGDLTQEKCADALARELVRHADGKLVFISTVVTIPNCHCLSETGALDSKVEVVCVFCASRPGLTIFVNRISGQVFVYDCGAAGEFTSAQLVEMCTGMTVELNTHAAGDESWKPTNADK